MKTFDDLVFEPHRLESCGVRAKLFFPNGYGVSVIRGPLTYGGSEGLWEMAVLKGTEEDYELCYDTPITNDVLGHKSQEEITEAMRQVQELPKSDPPAK